MYSDASISPCGRYRWSLTRIWNEKPDARLVGWNALNPSKADAKINDPTIEKEIAFSQRWGFDGLVKTNLYPWRETSPRKLFEASKNHNILGNSIMSLSEIVGIFLQNNPVEFVVCAWGTNANPKYARRIASRGAEFTELALAAGIRLFCLKKNKDGSPAHPLYLPPDTQLIPYGV